MDLKDRYSPAERLAFVRSLFKAGIVVRLFCTFTDPPKYKLPLIASATRDPPLCFVINTQPTPYAMRTPRLREQQKPIKKESNRFLDHDSYIDCSTAYENFTLDEIEKALVNDTTLILGSICPETVAAVLESIADSQTLSPIQINQIGMELSQSVQ